MFKNVLNDSQILIVRDCQRLGIEPKVLQVNIDFLDACSNGHFDACVSVVVKLYHRGGGNEHQDVGCGTIQNHPDKAEAVVLARRVILIFVFIHTCSYY